jgi:hypothetical protein
MRQKLTNQKSTGYEDYEDSVVNRDRNKMTVSELRELVNLSQPHRSLIDKN